MTVIPFPSSSITRPVALVPSFDPPRLRLVSSLHGGRSRTLSGAARVEQRCGDVRDSSHLTVLPTVSVLNSDRLAEVNGKRPAQTNGSFELLFIGAQSQEVESLVLCAERTPAATGLGDVQPTGADTGPAPGFEGGCPGRVASYYGARPTNPTRDTVAPGWGVASSDNERRSDVSRPVPLHSDVEGVLIDIEEWRRDAEKDGEITPDEAMRAVPLLLVLASLVRLWVMTMAHVSTCIQSAKGMFSQRAVRGWNQAHKQCPDNVIPFPAREFDPEVA